MSNACVNFEERRNCDAADGGYITNKNIIFPKTYISREYNCMCSVFDTRTFISEKNCHGNNEMSCIYLPCIYCRVYIGRVYMDHHTMTQILWCATTLPYFH